MKEWTRAGYGGSPSLTNCAQHRVLLEVYVALAMEICPVLSSGTGMGQESRAKMTAMKGSGRTTPAFRIGNTARNGNFPWQRGFLRRKGLTAYDVVIVK